MCSRRPTRRRSQLSLAAEIVATGQAMLRLGLVAGTSGNVSAREGELVRITPSALPYPEMTVDDLVTLGLDGTIVAGHREPSSERRVHLAVYAARPDARALVHSHSVHATALAEVTSRVLPRDCTRGRPSHGAQPDQSVSQIAGGLASSLATREALGGQQRCVILATNALDETP